MEIKRNRAMGIIVALFVLAVLIVAGTVGYFWYQKTHDQSAANGSTNGGSITIDTAPKLETETIQTALVIPASTDKTGDTIKLSAMSMTVPKTWRTLNGRAMMNTPLQSVYAESTNDILAQLIMVPETNPTDGTLATNSFSLYNITSWLKQPTVGQTGTATPAAKTAYIANIENLGKGASTDKNACAKGVGDLNATVCGTLLKPTPITTSDGTLHGIAYLNTQAQAVSYDPMAIVMLTGKVKDQQIFAYGGFHLIDNNSHTLNAGDQNAISAAWKSLTGGTIPADTTQLYQHVIDAVKSVSIQAN